MKFNFKITLIIVLPCLIIFAGWLSHSIWWPYMSGQSLTVAGASMEPTIKSGDKVRLLTNENSLYKQGDLVAVNFKTRERLMVKRIIAIAGDKVEWIDGLVKVNGSQLTIEGWPKDRRVPARSWKLLGLQLKSYNNLVPQNNVIVMGDNIRKSYDSGDFGMLSLSQISGHIVH